ncbi:hypothetical protein AZL_d02940 (plasmid) [Azospirillum sp. B510]|uniref:hypothetical protein n=1 Tax=Azospirillum sp. (strain B510) TaxID=137722 RepID=UPI0001C4C814|nr:hypothetical protein [Azospirillum sp. B510]BAI76120.1 hypothetical protein AZL_d02940 [Azospirillum sp. B510]
MEIRGVSSTTAVRSAAYQPTESGAASQSGAAEASVTKQPGGVATGAEKASGSGYISPFMRYDQGARVAVLYFRDFDTGETQDQIPSQRVVEEYRRTASRLTQENVQGKMAGSQTAAKSSPNSSTTSAPGNSSDGAGSAPGGGVSPAGSAAGSAAPASLAVSFASGAGGGAAIGTSSGASPLASAQTGGGAAPSTTGGSYGGSPGGLVSVTV